jgi:hypothetical protein
MKDVSVWLQAILICFLNLKSTKNIVVVYLLLMKYDIYFLKYISIVI